MARDGITRAAAFVTSAYASYSGCRQYRENLYDAVQSVGDGRSAPRLDKLRHSFNHPGFVTACADGVLDALGRLPDAERTRARLVFVTHSIPEAMAASAGPEGGAYVRQHRSAAGLVTDAVRGGHRHHVPVGSRLLQQVRIPVGSVAGARCERPSRDARRRRCDERGAGADRLRLRPHGGRLRSRHRGIGDRRATRAARRSSRDGRDSIPPSSPWSATSCSNGPPWNAVRPMSPVPAMGALGPAWDVCAARLLPEPARRSARPLPAARGGRVVTLLDLAVDVAHRAGR